MAGYLGVHPDLQLALVSQLCAHPAEEPKKNRVCFPFSWGFCTALRRGKWSDDLQHLEVFFFLTKSHSIKQISNGLRCSASVHGLGGETSGTSVAGSASVFSYTRHAMNAVHLLTDVRGQLEEILNVLKQFAV